MNRTSRIDTFTNTLREACKTEVPASYIAGSTINKLTTLSAKVDNLCWEIAYATKQADPSNKIIAADDIKNSATNVINICIAELKNLGHTSEDAIKLITTDGALWFWDLNQHPLNKLDQDVNPIERIQSLHVAKGLLMEWWPIGISPENHIEPADTITQLFVNLAYEAICAIIAEI